jgi:hypothetical protein
VAGVISPGKNEDMHSHLNKIVVGSLLSLASLGLAACGDAADPVAAEEASSLEDYFGYGDPAAQQAQLERRQRAAEASIVECMRAQGFEYTPFIQQGTFSLPPQPKRGEEVAYKRKYGYNFTSFLTASTPQTQSNENPNDKRVAAMSEAERNAYQKALYGFDVTKAQADPSVIPDGCQNKAWSSETDLWTPLIPKFEALQRKTDADPKIAKLNASFVSCMRKAGHSINKESDIYEKLLSPRQQKLFNDTFSSSPETSVASSQASVPTIPQAKIDEFQKYELLVANADADCRPQKEVDQIRVIRATYEKAFIDENKASLDKLKVSQG